MCEVIERVTVGSLAIWPHFYETKVLQDFRILLTPPLGGRESHKNHLKEVLPNPDIRAYSTYSMEQSPS